MVGFLGPTAWPPGRLELTITERRPKDLMTHGFGCRPPMGQFLSCVGGGTCRGCSQCDLYPSTGGPRNLRSRQRHADEGSSRASAISLPERRKPLGGHPTQDPPRRGRVQACPFLATKCPVGADGSALLPQSSAPQTGERIMLCPKSNPGRTFLAVQWLRLCTSIARGCGFKPWSGN